MTVCGIKQAASERGQDVKQWRTKAAVKPDTTARLRFGWSPGSMAGAPLRRLLSFSFISSELLFIFGSPVHSYSLPPVLCRCCLSDHWGEIDCCVRLANRRMF